MGIIISLNNYVKNNEYPETAEQYIKICKSILTQDDYEELLCAIIDKTYYNAADYDIQRIVDCYNSY